MNREDMDPGMGLYHLWGIMYLRWKIIAVAFASAMAIAFLLQTARAGSSTPDVVQSVDEDPRYTASAVYAVVPSTEGTAVGALETARLAQVLTETYRYALGTDSVLEPLASDLSLSIPLDELRASLSISAQHGTPFLTVAAEMDTSADAVAVVNGFADALAGSVAYAAIDLGSVSANLEIVEPAQVAALLSTTPTPAPTGRTIPTVAVFAFVGLLLGVIAAWLVERADGLANWPRQVSDDTGLRVLGSSRDGGRGDPDLEPFRVAKARIKAALPGRAGSRSLLVTSPHAGEWKTPVVANLARTLAEDGSSVVVVSADVRSQQSLENHWGHEAGRPGLSDFLSDVSVSVDDVLSETSVDGVSVVTRGTMPAQVILLVDSLRMHELLDRLRERVDWLLIDADGALDTADAARLAPLADGTVLMVDGRRTTVSSARAAADTLSEAGGTLVGFFHNRARSNPVARLLHQEAA